MGTLRPWVFLVVLLLPAVARAGDHRFDRALGASYLDAKGSVVKLGGLHYGESWTIKNKWLSLIGDFSWHFKDIGDETNDAEQFALVVGSRFTVLQSHWMRQSFLQAMLAGLIQKSGIPDADASKKLAFVFGGGKDFPFGPGRHQAIRAEINYVAPLSGEVGRGFRYGVSFVWRFHDRPSATPAASDPQVP